MKTDVLKNTIKLIEDAGITKYTIFVNNTYLIDVNSDSTKVVFDDAKELLWFFRVPNNVQPKDPKPIAVECLEYELIERISVPTDYIGATNIAKGAGLTLTEEVTKWLKTACSQIGTYPIQNDMTADNKDNTKPYRGMPTII